MCFAHSYKHHVQTFCLVRWGRSVMIALIGFIEGCVHPLSPPCCLFLVRLHKVYSMHSSPWTTCYPSHAVIFITSVGGRSFIWALKCSNRNNWLRDKPLTIWGKSLSALNSTWLLCCHFAPGNKISSMDEVEKCAANEQHFGACTPWDCVVTPEWFWALFQLNKSHLL